MALSRLVASTGQKINDRVLDTWAAILQGYPESRLLIGNMTDAEMISAMTKRFKQRGVSQNRLLFRGLVELDEYLALHHEIDILLDAFPTAAERRRIMEPGWAFRQLP